MENSTEYKHIDGIYFNMPFEEYLAIPALSASGIKKLCISSMDFWAESWMNPNRPERKEAKHFLDGSAYHARILEGAEVFNSLYAPEFDGSEYPDALKSTDDLKDWLRHAKSMGEDVKLTGNKSFLIEQIHAIDSDVEIFDALKQGYFEAWAGYEFIDRETMAQIELAAAMIENHPELSKCFQGGYPEVTILWHDSDTGVRMKARIDFLKPRAIVDLKTFANKSGKPIDRAIYTDIAANNYHIQAALYYKAVELAREFVKDGKVYRGGCSVADVWLQSFVETQESHFVFVYQQKGIAPVSRGKIFPKSMIYDCATYQIRDAIERFVDCQKTYGSMPWVDVQPIEGLDDTGFPAWIGEA